MGSPGLPNVFSACRRGERARLEISVSDAVRMLLVRVAAEKALPFEVRVPNATTVKATRAAGRGKGKRLDSAAALFKDLGI